MIRIERLPGRLVGRCRLVDVGVPVKLRMRVRVRVRVRMRMARSSVAMVGTVVEIVRERQSVEPAEPHDSSAQGKDAPERSCWHRTPLHGSAIMPQRDGATSAVPDPPVLSPPSPKATADPPKPC